MNINPIKIWDIVGRIENNCRIGSKYKSVHSYWLIKNLIDEVIQSKQDEPPPKKSS